MSDPDQPGIIVWDLGPVFCSPQERHEFFRGYSLFAAFAAVVLLIVAAFVA